MNGVRLMKDFVHFVLDVGPGIAIGDVWVFQ
jgi:hypothetical protein